jgi:hypothetical protein
MPVIRAGAGLTARQAPAQVAACWQGALSAAAHGAQVNA